MKPAPFDYVRAATRAEALDTLAARAARPASSPAVNPSCRCSTCASPARGRAGGHQGAEGGSGSRCSATASCIGAAVRQAAVERRPGLAGRQPLLAAALAHVGHAQTRSRGTICGSVAHADPSAEMPLVLGGAGRHGPSPLAPGAAAGGRGGFFTGMMATGRADDEMIEAVGFPLSSAGPGYAFREIARRHGDFAIVGVAVVHDRGRPASRRRRRRPADGARPPARGERRWTTRSTRSPGTWTPATTCMRPPAIAASWSAASAAVIEEAVRCRV